MIIQKVTFGFVVQQFDTEARKFIGQEFIGSDDRHWETQDERTLNLTENNDAALVYGLGGVDEPYLAYEMTQPKAPQQPLVANIHSFSEGETVVVTPLDDGSDPQNEFMGKVIGFKDDRYVQVRDQEDNVFDCEPVQVHHV